MKPYIELMRVKHYIKNLVIFLPLVFSVQLLDIKKFTVSFIGFLGFCFLSSIVYIFNDIQDVEKDRKHKVKKTRPIASGKISKKRAIGCIGILLIIWLTLNLGLLLYCKVDNNLIISSTTISIIYLVLNLTYSKVLKNYPIVDVTIIVIGFILRMAYGATLTGIEISNWLYLTVMAGSFYMGFGKRRNETVKNGDKSRSVLGKYSKEFLDRFMYVCLTLVIVFYSLWCIDASTIERVGNNYMILTIPLLLIMLMKYSLDIETDSDDDPVEVILNDRLLMTLSIVFISAIIVNIYIL